MTTKDFVRDGEDLLIVAGDFVVDESTTQHQKDIIVCEKGWNKFFPLAGVGIYTYLNDSETAIGLKQAIRYELARDGQVGEKVGIKGCKIQIEAVYG